MRGAKIYQSFNSTTNSRSISHSPNGWTDKELGAKWLERDFHPQTAARNKSGGYRLLILDGHNSHCSYKFCHFAEKHNIIVICLPSHTTHVLQPCDVGVFGPLASCWKSIVNKAAGGYVPITKTNVIAHYSEARDKAFKPDTIKNAFRKTGIWPMDRNALDPIVYEPSKNTTTQAAQPLPADLTTLVVPIEIVTEPPAVETSATTDSSTPILAQTRTRFRLAIPNPLPHTSSRHDLHQQVLAYHDLLKRTGEQIERDYAQMKLMDLENAKLRQRVFAKEKKKGKDKRSSAEARHMTSKEVLEALAKADWTSGMQEVFKQAKEVFKEREKNINDHYKRILEQEKRERQLDKKHAAAMKKRGEEAEKQEAAWRREMAGLGKYASDLLEREKKQKMKAKSKAVQPKTVRTRARSERRQAAKEGERPKTPAKRRAAAIGGGNRRTQQKPVSPTATESSGESFNFADDGSSSSPSSPPPQPVRPRPRPRPLRGARAQAATGSSLDVVAPAVAHPSPSTHRHVQPHTPARQRLRHEELEGALISPMYLPATPSTQRTLGIAIPQTMAHVPPMSVREPRRILRFQLDANIAFLSDDEEITPPPSPTRGPRKNNDSQGVQLETQASKSTKAHESVHQPRRSARLNLPFTPSKRHGHRI